LILKPSNSEKH